MRIDFDISQLSIPDGNTLDRVVAASMNKAVAKANTSMSKETRKIYNIKAKDLNKTIGKIRATKNNLTTKVLIRSRPVSLRYFNAKEVNVRGANGRTYKGVSAKIVKGSRQKRIKGAFFGRVNGQRQVFSRVSNGRLPIRKLAVYTTPTMVDKHGDDEFFREFNSSFRSNYSNQLDRAMRNNRRRRR